MEPSAFQSASFPSCSPDNEPRTHNASQSMLPSDPSDWEGAQPRESPPRFSMDTRLTEKEEEGRGRKRKRDTESRERRKGNRKGKGRATSPISLSSSASSRSRSVSSAWSAGSSSPSQSLSHPRRSSHHSRSYKRHSTKRRRSKTPAHMIFWNQVKDSSNETVEALRKVRPEVLRMLGNEGFLKLDHELANLQFKYNQLKKKYGKVRERLDMQIPCGQTYKIASASAPPPPSIQYQSIQLDSGQQLLMLPTVEPAVIRPPGYRGLWTYDEWMATKSSSKAKPSNSSFLLNADGSPLSDSECRIIRRTLRDVLNFLGKNIEFRLQSSLNDKQFRDHTVISLESAHPVLAQCEQHWKVTQLLVENYKSWLESFFRRSEQENSAPWIYIPKVLSGAWGQNKFGSYLRLTPEQVEEYQLARNSSLTPPPPAQPRQSKYALTLAANQSRNLGNQSGPRAPPLLPSHPIPSSSIVPPPPPASMFRNPAEILHQPTPESEPMVDLHSINVTPTAAPAQGVLQVMETSFGTPGGTQATAPPPYPQPFSQTIEPQPFSRHYQDHPPQISAPSAALSTFPPPVQENAIPGIDPALVQKSIRRGRLTGNNESEPLPGLLPSTPPFLLTTPTTPPLATSSSIPPAPPSIISTTVLPDPPPALPSAALPAPSPTTSPAMPSVTPSAAHPIYSTTEPTNTRSASFSTPMEIPAPPASTIPVEYNKTLWLGMVKDFKGKKNVYRARINDNCPENLAGADWAMNKKQNKDTRNKNQDFAEYWGSISVDDKTLWFEKAKSLGYAVGIEPSRKNKNKKSD